MSAAGKRAAPSAPSGEAEKGDPHGARPGPTAPGNPPPPFPVRWYRELPPPLPHYGLGWNTGTLPHLQRGPAVPGRRAPPPTRPGLGTPGPPPPAWPGCTGSATTPPDSPPTAWDGIPGPPHPRGIGSETPPHGLDCSTGTPRPARGNRECDPPPTPPPRLSTAWDGTPGPPHPDGSGSGAAGMGALREGKGGGGGNGAVPVCPQPPPAAGHGLGRAVPRLLPAPGRRDPPRCPPRTAPPGGVRRRGLRLWGAAG